LIATGATAEPLKSPMKDVVPVAAAIPPAPTFNVCAPDELEMLPPAKET
jgi:hypothetical protein